jgi:hypothetical protein
MDGLREFLGNLKRHHYARGNFLGLLNILIGRRIETAGGKVLSQGLTWRAAAEMLKRVRWDKDATREVGLDPRALPPRDRFRYWYVTIAHARVDSPEATQAGDRLGEKLQAHGYLIGPAPGVPPSQSTTQA